MFLGRALRYRRSQAVVLAGVSLLIGTCATFAPWFARAVEQTVTTETLTDRPLVAAWQLEALPPPSSAGASKPTAPEELKNLVPPDLRPLFGPPVYGAHVDVTWLTGPEITAPKPEGRLLWRDGYCERLTLTAGRCPDAPNEVAASTADVENHGIKLGQRLNVNPTQYVGSGTLTVVGLYLPQDAQDLYWFGRPPTGHSHTGPTDSDPGGLDYLLTGRSTFDQAAWGHRNTVDTRPLPSITRLDDLQRLKDATTTVEGNAKQLGYNAVNTSGLIGLVDAVAAERRQATTIIPLVMVQVALFGVVVLALALAAVVDQRRPELAVARLRGSSTRRAGRTLTLELATPVLAGTLAGLLSGFALLLVVRATWLDGGSPLELPWTVPAALAVALLVGAGVVAWTVRSVVRLPISTLLRRVVPRRRGRAVAIGDVAIVVLATAALVAALTGGGRGPLPVLTPTLLALAVGLTFAHLLLPTAALVSRRALRAGRLGLALGALQVSRRPAVTRIVAVVAVATALVSFAGQAASVAGSNRETRAGYEVGAAGVIEANATGLGPMLRALDAVDPDRRWSTPVLVGTTASPDALRTMMIEPDSFRRVAFRGEQLTDEQGFQALRAPAAPAPIELRGTELEVTASTGPMRVLLPKTLDGQEPPSQPPPKAVILEATVVSLRDDSRFSVRFPALPLVPGRSRTLTADLACEGGCRLVRLGVTRPIDDVTGVEGDVVISELGIPGRPGIELGGPSVWQPTAQLGGQTGALTATGGSGSALTLHLASVAVEQSVQHASIPPVLPALISSGHPVGEGTTVPGLDGIAAQVRKLDLLDGPINRYPERTAVVDLETMRRLGGGVDPLRIAFEIWLTPEGLANADRVLAALEKERIDAKVADRSDDVAATYGRSASALALQLTPVVGIAGWSLAIIVLLLMVVTSWRSRAQDYASLKITGVPAATTGRAARWEQTGPVALAVLLGSACGVVGAQIALPLIPLFADTGQPSAIPLDLGTNWVVAAVLWLIGTVVLTTTTVLLGAGVNRRAGYQRIREDLS
ncbi:protein of unknown function DUF214 [Kribbella flavida DSM 17836]|uniref:ABC3 transporter permease C-terminal domain-containing protein n=1 Tax=Kribbella flavida (strain DSM 17836 / JCM 10339 / NBRC 14399) TaxID=479435 RepID=D2PW60_KRIFD|nr:FtsX-like permease family protein [Kribbella flavida]ADB31512.1 protein of unknown function DUF214 [Kribbella flavida DSM 17836]